jgi:hypothetical protein
MYCAENLFFWMDAENYSNVPGADYRRSTAKRIFRKYISTEAKLQLNISDVIAEQIADGVEHADKDLFKKVCEVCYAAIFSQIISSYEWSNTVLCCVVLCCAVLCRPSQRFAG